MKSILALMICTMLLFVAACSDDDMEPSVDGFTINQFPIQVGDFWLYEVIDSSFTLTGDVTVTIDTVEVRVADTLYVDSSHGLPYTVFVRFEFDDGETTWDASTGAKGDTLLIDQLRAVLQGEYVWPWPGVRWHFPLEVGKSWSVYPQTEDQIMVVGKGKVTLPIYEFADGYQIHRDWNMPNAAGQSDSWVVPEVGIAKFQFRSTCTVCLDDFQQSSTWTMLSWFGAFVPLD